MAKVNWEIDYNEEEVVMICDTEIHVKKQIPYEKKMEMVGEYADMVVVLQDNYAFVSPYSDVSWLYLVLKYYTDVELDENDDLGKIYDFDLKYSVLPTIRKVCGTDMCETKNFATELAYEIVRSWTEEHTLQATLTNLLSEETMESLSHSPELNNELIDFLHSRQEDGNKNKTIVSLAEFAKKKVDE